MLNPRITQRQGGRELKIPIDKFKGGVNKLLEEARIGMDEAKEAINLMQVQDGLWKVRWGTAYYGADAGADIDGAAEYVNSNGSTELIVVAGGIVKKSTDGGALSTVTGATFTAGIQCYFMQIAGNLYIANGTDSLARYNGTTLSQYVEIAAPTGLAATRGSGLASGPYNIYAQVTALNGVGETVGSTQATVTVSKERDLWVTASEYIDWNWNTVSGAERYQLYISDESGNESLLTSVETNTYRDDGSFVINPYVQPPLQNTTGAPKFKSMAVSGNRIWGTNSSAEPFTVWYSGVGNFIGNFSDFYGGGWIALERGGRERPISVVHYQSGQGEGVATVLCSTPEGKGAVWQISISSATVGDTSFSVPSAQKIVGSYGTEALLSTVATDNDILFLNRNGVYSLGPEKNFYGILRTRELSSRIRPYLRGLIGSQINKVCAYFYDAKVFFSVPTSSAGNNRIIIYDLERTNWIVDWSVGARQFLQYTDTSGKTHFLYVPVGGSRLIEISPSIQGDLGQAFSTSYISGRWTLTKNWTDFAKFKKLFIKLGSPRGSINVEVAGTQKNKPFSSVGAKTIVPEFSSTGMGFDMMGSVLMGDTAGTPSTFSDSADIRYIVVNKRVRDYQIRITTNAIDADYTLLGFIVEGRELQVKAPSSWRLN